MKFIIGIFFIFHGIVHVFYGLHSLRVIELTPGLQWPANSWVFLKLTSKKTIQWVSACFCFLAAPVFIFTGIYHLVTATMLNTIVWIGCAISTLVYLLFWDGRVKKLNSQGFYGIVINVAIFFMSYLMFY
jgi:hypothetical protein